MPDEITSQYNWNAKAYRVYLAYESLKNNAESRESFFENYRGIWDDEAAYTQDWYESCYNMSELPEWVRDHVDWDSLSKDLFSSSVYSDDSSDRGIYVFENS